MHKKITNTTWGICIVMLLFLLKTQAQQDPQYTQYMYNMNVVNLSQKMTNNLLKVTDWGRVMGK